MVNERDFGNAHWWLFCLTLGVIWGVVWGKKGQGSPLGMWLSGYCGGRLGIIGPANMINMASVSQEIENDASQAATRLGIFSNKSFYIILRQNLCYGMEETRVLIWISKRKNWTPYWQYVFHTVCRILLWPLLIRRGLLVHLSHHPSDLFQGSHLLALIHWLGSCNDISNRRSYPWWIEISPTHS